MNDIKTIGGAGGIFHILVPGVFLLLNVVFTLYFFPPTNSTVLEDISRLLSNPTTGLVFTVSFGYLIGVVLRIFQCELADKSSAWFLRTFNKTAKEQPCERNLWAHEIYPYTKWLGVLAERLPEDARKFYSKFWEKGDTKTFLNFCKVLIISKDERAANEIYAAEALCRYISSMLYALCVATGLLCIILFSQAYELYDSIGIFIAVLLIGYLIAIVGILRNFRFMRLKEVQTIFFAAYQNRDLFGVPKPDNGKMT